MKSFTPALLVSFVSVAYAASSSSLIPDGISNTCSDFLNKLNSDTTLAACAKSFSSATGAFAPGSKNDTSSATAVNSALSTLCGSSTGCSSSAVRSQLTSFYAACTDELTGSSPNTAVRNAYDVLYSFTPLRDAMCTKDSSTAKYCALSSPASVSAPTTASLSNFKSSNIPYLFLTPTLSSDELCTPCTKAVLSAYAAWEALLTFPYGLANSGILGGQVDLWNGVTATCGADFMTTVTSNTGTTPLGQGALSGAMSVKGSVAAASFTGAAVISLISFMML